MCYRKSDEMNIHGFCDAIKHLPQRTGGVFPDTAFFYLKWISDFMEKYRAKRGRSLNLRGRVYCPLNGSPRGQFLKPTFKWMDGDDHYPVTIMGDNQASISLLKNPITHERSILIWNSITYATNVCKGKFVKEKILCSLGREYGRYLYHASDNGQTVLWKLLSLVCEKVSLLVSIAVVRKLFSFPIFLSFSVYLNFVLSSNFIYSFFSQGMHFVKLWSNCRYIS